jgi:hypothetical protein
MSISKPKGSFGFSSNPARSCFDVATRFQSEAKETNIYRVTQTEMEVDGREGDQIT